MSPNRDRHANAKVIKLLTIFLFHFVLHAGYEQIIFTFVFENF